jgi:simple sugar transport system permease protein
MSTNTSVPSPPLGGAARARRQERHLPLYRRLIQRPEIGAAASLVAVLIFFGAVAPNSGMFSLRGISGWLEVSAYLGVIAIGACILIIGGEFDLSVGSMIGFAGIVIAVPVEVFDWPPWLAIMLSFVAAMTVGLLNGFLINRTGLPSFIVTLASLFILRGFAIAGSRAFTKQTIIGGMRMHEKLDNDWLAQLLGGEVGRPVFAWLAAHGLIGTVANGDPEITGIRVIIIWWILLTLFAAWFMKRTIYGNWIFSIGGDINAARNMGIPVPAVKIGLFMFSGATAALFATAQVVQFSTASADRGLLMEFQAIISAVIGGTLLTGGYGVPIGASFGALVFGVVSTGIFYTRADPDLFRVFLGLMLLVAVMVNNILRRRATGRE